MRSNWRRYAILLLAGAWLLGVVPTFSPSGAEGPLISFAPKVLAAIDGGPDLDSRGQGGEAKSLQRGAGSPGGLKGLWIRLADSALGRRVGDVVGWVSSFFRFLWAIPKALLQGDSRSMIEALGDLLSRTSPSSGEADGSEPTESQPIPASGATPAEAAVLGGLPS